MTLPILVYQLPKIDAPSGSEEMFSGMAGGRFGSMRDRQSGGTGFGRSPGFGRSGSYGNSGFGQSSYDGFGSGQAPQFFRLDQG